MLSVSDKDMSTLFSSIELPSKKVLISAAASMATAAMLIRSIARDFIPDELRYYAANRLHRFFITLSNEATVVIDEFDGLNKNRLFYAAELYVGTITSSAVRTYRAALAEKEKKIHVSLGGHEEITDNFRGIKVKWVLITSQTQTRWIPAPDEYNTTMITEFRYLKLTFHKKHYKKVVDEYLPYVLERSEGVREKEKTLKLFTLKHDRYLESLIQPWESVNLDHPATFDTLAMDDDMKSMIVADLDTFLKRKEYYRRVGKAWKRGYLLFGPPGTGKSTLIAAMANYLNFDVYDLELTDIKSDSELKKLLISTENRSILVVEDIDASIDLCGRRRSNADSSMNSFQYEKGGSKVTLSGLLNFIDGLWSSTGDQRIIIFTTNHKERLDPALLRPGRMDVHIHMSYCTPCGFRLLARNYLGLTDIENNPLVSKAEGLIGLRKVTPAEVGEQLLKSEDPEVSLLGLIKFLEEEGKEDERCGEEYFVETKEKKKRSKEECDGLRALVKIAKTEMNGSIVRTSEAANALKLVIGYLKQTIDNDSGSPLAPTETQNESVIPNDLVSVTTNDLENGSAQSEIVVPS